MALEPISPQSQLTIMRVMAGVNAVQSPIFQFVGSLLSRRQPFVQMPSRRAVDQSHKQPKNSPVEAPELLNVSCMTLRDALVDGFSRNWKKGWRATDLGVQELSKSNFDDRFLMDIKTELCKCRLSSIELFPSPVIMAAHNCLSAKSSDIKSLEPISRPQSQKH
jgi:hypothetical protein